MTGKGGGGPSKVIPRGKIANAHSKIVAENPRCKGPRTYRHGHVIYFKESARTWETELTSRQTRPEEWDQKTGYVH